MKEKQKKKKTTSCSVKEDRNRSDFEFMFLVRTAAHYLRCRFSVMTGSNGQGTPWGYHKFNLADVMLGLYDHQQELKLLSAQELRYLRRVQQIQKVVQRGLTARKSIAAAF